MAKTNEDIYNVLVKMSESLDKLVSLWEEKEQKLVGGSKKAISTGAHLNPLTPEQQYYARLANENKAESQRM